MSISIEKNIAVLIPTCNRSEILSRALSSILAQTQEPECIVVCDDSDESNKIKNSQVIEGLKSDFQKKWPAVKIVHLLNKRTPGLSGNSNTGLVWLMQHFNPSNCLVASLDDDDTWEQDYLQKVFVEFCSGYEFIVAGMVRHESNEKSRKLTIPTELNSKHFEIGNPNIQGSNKAVTLKLWLMAGLFDEALPSCTDRDVGIRILELGDVRVKIIHEYLVHHFADNGRGRLTEKGSPAHQRGALRFYKKYQHRLSPEKKEAARKRHLEYHGFDPFCSKEDLEEEENNSLTLQKTFPLPKSKHHSILMDVGIIVLPHENIDKLVEDLIYLVSDKRIKRLRVFLVCDDTQPQLISQLTSLKENGIDTVLASFSSPETGFPYGSIASNRSKLRKLIKQNQNQYADVVWLVDADMHFRPRNGEGELDNEWDWLGYLLYFKEQGVDCFLGSYLGAPPIPAVGMMRGQLLDLAYNLEALATYSPERHLFLNKENCRIRKENPEYYYDFGKKATSFNETFFSFEFSKKQNTALNTFQKIADGLTNLLDGEPITRRICGCLSCDDLNLYENADCCGGATFIFNQELLNLPLSVPKYEGRPTRRGDMLWALNVRMNKFKIIKSFLPVYQSRIFKKEPTLDFDKWFDDLLGYAISTAIRKIIEERERINSSQNFSSLTNAEKEKFKDIFSDALNTRFTLFEENFYRIGGLIKLLEHLVIPSSSSPNKHWWFIDNRVQAHLEKFTRFVQILQTEYDLKFLNSLKTRVNAVNIESFLNWAETFFSGEIQ